MLNAELVNNVNDILKRAEEYHLVPEVVTTALLWLGDHSPSDNNDSCSYVIDALEVGCREWDV